MPAPLRAHPLFRPRRGPIVLCILDGIGIGRGEEDDAVATARTPHLSAMRANFPNTMLRAHGLAVGLPSDEDMGNSEVGHNAMGCGRVFQQGARLVDIAIETGSIFAGETWSALCATNTLHLLGLVSDGNVHSHISHLYAIIDAAARSGVKRLRVHALTDGRDVEARSALTYLRPLEERLAAHTDAGRDYRIASGGGRMKITMDRYQADWAMVERGWDVHVRASGRAFPSASVAVETLYAEDPKVDDQTLPPFIVLDPNGARSPIIDGDGVLLFNFRGDRAVEISQAFEQEAFTAFARGPRPAVIYAGLMQYDGDLKLPARYLVEPPAIDETVGEYLALGGRHSFVCSETQKYGHVTYFFNGNRSGVLDDRLEVYQEIPSDLLPFEERPWMKAAEIADAVIAAIGSGRFDHVRLNFANGDMVGHTGVLEATRIAVEAVDLQLGRLWAATRAAQGVLLVTADHGNADEMWMRDRGSAKIKRSADGSPLARPSHTLNPVPFIVCDPLDALTIAPTAPMSSLAAVGTTLLDLAGLSAPGDYLPGLVAPR